MPRTIARSGCMKGRRSFILMSSLVVECRAQLLRNDLRRGTGRRQEEELAVAVDDVDEDLMRAGVVIAVLGLYLLVDDFERFCGCCASGRIGSARCRGRMCWGGALPVVRLH